MAVDIFSDDLPREEFEAGYDPDATAVSRPVDDGRYDAELIFGEQNPKERWRSTDTTPTHFWTNLHAKFDDNRRAFSMISTRPFPIRDSEKLNSSATRLLKSLGEDGRADADNPLDLARAVDTVVSGGVRAVVRTQWLASCRDCRTNGFKWTKAEPTGIRGQKHFPLSSSGDYNPLAPCPRCGEEMNPATADFTVVRRAE